MISTKQLWQSMYELIKYTDYEFYAVNEAQTDVTFQNKKNHHLIRFINEKQNVQSLTFLLDRMDNQLDGGKAVIYLINQERPSVPGHPRLEVRTLQSRKDTAQLPIAPAYRLLTSRQQAKSQKFYQSKVLAGNFIDHAMIKFSWVTAVLILLNVLVFIISFLVRWTNKETSFVDQGGLSHFNFIHGDYYRIFTAMFLHLDFQHLLFNMMSLYIFGKLIDYLYGSWKYILIYFGGGIISNLVSLSFDTSSTSVGASGAISALMGGLLAYFIFSRLFERKFILQTTAGIIIFLLISNFFGRVNNYAHFGGMFGGLLIATLIYLMAINRRYFYFALAGTALILLLLFINIFSQPENHIYNEAALKEMQQGHFKAASVILKDTFDHGYEDAQSYQLYGLIKTNEDSLSEGIATWKKGLEVFPSSDLLNYQMALAERAAGDYKAADKYITKAIAVNPLTRYKTLQKEIKVFGE